MKNKINLILANATMRDMNLGTVALTVSSIFVIDEILKSKGVEYKLYLCNGGFYDKEKHYLHYGERSIEYIPCENIRRLSLKSKILSLLKISDFIRNYKILKKADFILDLGWGDSFSDIYGKYRFEVIDNIHYVSRLLNKKYCLLPQTIGPFESEIIQKKARKSLQHSTLVMARDKISCDYAKEICHGQIKCNEYIDMAFFLPYKKQKFDNNFIHVGINISDLLRMGGYTHKNEFGLMVDYNHIIKSIINYFLSIDNVKVHLIGHVVNGDINIESDYTACKTIYYEYNKSNLVLADFFLTPIEAKSYISGLDFFIGARMHATIAAFSSCVPVVPMAYSRKFNGLFVKTLKYPYMVDMKHSGEREILDNIKKWFEERSVLRECEELQMRTTVAEAGLRIKKDLGEFLYNG